MAKIQGEEGNWGDEAISPKKTGFMSTSTEWGGRSIPGLAGIAEGYSDAPSVQQMRAGAQRMGAQARGSALASGLRSAAARGRLGEGVAQGIQLEMDPEIAAEQKRTQEIAQGQQVQRVGTQKAWREEAMQRQRNSEQAYAMREEEKKRLDEERSANFWATSGLGMAKTIGTIMAIAAMSGSDEKKKQKIKPGGDKTQDFLDALSAKQFEYKPGALQEFERDKAKQIGILAQDLPPELQSRLGGTMALDPSKTTGPMLAGLAHLNERINQMQKGASIGRSLEQEVQRTAPAQGAVQEWEMPNIRLGTKKKDEDDRGILEAWPMPPPSLDRDNVGSQGGKGEKWTWNPPMKGRKQKTPGGRLYLSEDRYGSPGGGYVTQSKEGSIFDVATMYPGGVEIIDEPEDARQEARRDEIIRQAVEAERGVLQEFEREQMPQQMPPPSPDRAGKTPEEDTPMQGAERRAAVRRQKLEALQQQRDQFADQWADQMESGGMTTPQAASDYGTMSSPMSEQQIVQALAQGGNKR